MNDGRSEVGARRKLTARHIQFMAIGGAVGAGLFLGSGVAIAAAGPAILLCYGVCGLMIFLVGRALGEMAVEDPSAGAFTVQVERQLGHRIGFATAWSYWLVWILVGIAELTATGIFIRFWFPAVPQWLPALLTLLILYAVNQIGVRVFGEVEFWLTLVKVATILTLIVGGLVVLVLGRSPGETAAWSNLWSHGGVAPLGWAQVLLAAPIALFAFGGVELIGLAAAEAEHPERTLPSAINGVVLRILIFYVGSLGIIMALLPWSAIHPDTSPYVQALTSMGLPSAAGIINFVALTAVVSSCNSGLFATSRTLAALAVGGQAPAARRRLGGAGVPHAATTVSAAAMAAGVVLNFVAPERALSLVMSMASALLLWTWATILEAHRRYRRGHGAGRFAMPLHPASSYIAAGFLVLIAALMVAAPDTRSAILTTTAWMILLLTLAPRRAPPRGPQASQAQVLAAGDAFPS